MYKDLKNIYDSLVDEESRMIFRYRLLYSLTGEGKYIRDWMAQYSQEEKGYYDIFDIYKYPKIIKNKKVVLFGTGLWSNVIRRVLYFCDCSFDFYCDNDQNKIGKELLGRKIISVAELAEVHKDAMVVIATQVYQDEILSQLKELKFNKEQIIQIPRYERMYTDNTLVSPEGKEVFLDCGCCDGKSSIEFFEWCNGNGKVYAFEPDKGNIEQCKEKLSSQCKAEYCLIEKGVWSQDTVLHFREDNGGTSRISTEGTVQVAVTSIDNVIKSEDKVTFIKMDIEGSELEALKGAAQTIKKDKPRLAISLYHKMEDILDIPLYIKSLEPKYKFYLRSYVPIDDETVLYALYEE